MKVKSHLIGKACRENNIEKLKELMQTNLNVNAKDNSGFAPLHWATTIRSYEMAEILLKNNADPNIKNRRGHTAMDMVFNRYRAMELLSALTNSLQKVPHRHKVQTHYKKAGENSFVAPHAVHEETIRFFKLLHNYHARDFDIENVFVTCKKYGIPKIVDVLVKDGYDIDKIRKQRELNERIERKNNQLREKKLQKILSQKGYFMKKIGEDNPAYRFKYYIFDRKTKNWAPGIDARRVGLTLDEIEINSTINHRRKQ